MQSAMHGTDRRAHCLRNVTESGGWFAHFSWTVLDGDLRQPKIVWVTPSLLSEP